MSGLWAEGKDHVRIIEWYESLVSGGEVLDKEEKCERPTGGEETSR